MYTVKKALAEPSEMNSVINKERRSEYVTNLMAANASKHVIYIDETNINLFLRRGAGRSRKGTRCSVKTPTARGKNVHIVAGELLI